MKEFKMGFKIEKLMISKEKMDKGVWKDFIPFAGVKIQLLIASSANQEYIDAVGRIIRDNLKEVRDDVAGIKQHELLKPAVAKHILLGWKGIDGSDGKPLVYSAEAALKLLNTPELFHLYDWVRVQAEITANFRKELLEESEKN
jgi:hypothetical protein